MTLNVTRLQHTRRQAARTRITDNRRDYVGARPIFWVAPDRSVSPDQTFWGTRRVIGQRGGTPCRSHQR